MSPVRFTVLLLPVLLMSACGGPPPPDIILVTVDTLRADHTSAFGYEFDTTPHLAALAGRGAAFSRCVSQHPETGPSFASMMTSRHPRETGVRENGALLPADLPTLAEAFRAAGYRTGAFVSTYLLKPHACKLERGFDEYDHEMDAPNLGKERFERLAEDTVARALAWLDARPEEPAFLWVHLYDPHGLYDPGEETARRFRKDRGLPDLDPSRIVAYQRFGESLSPDDYIARYDGEVHLADRAAGRLFDAVGERAVVAFTADHGEGLGERDYWFRHGSLLNAAALRVPLVFAGPGVPGAFASDRVVTNLDVAPTLLDLAGLPPLPEARGSSLVPHLRGELPDDPGPAFSEARRMGGVRDRTGVDTRYKVSATTATHRLVLWPRTAEEVLHDLAADPGENRDVSGEAPEVADALGAALRRWLLVGDRIAGREEASGVSDALRGLGYLNGGDRR